MLGPAFWILSVGDIRGQQQNRRCSSLNHEGFCRTEAASIIGFPGKVPTLTMRMKVVPHRAQVQIENVPADFLSRFRQDGGRVAHKRQAVQTEAWQSPAIFRNGVDVVVTVVPMYFATGTDLGLGRTKLYFHRASVALRY